MAENPLLTIKQLGQSIWLDYIQRDLIENGELRRLIEEDGICGVTSNPAILEKAIAGHDDYNDAIKALVVRGADAMDMYEQLALGDVQQAADLLRPVYDQTEGGDGFVSLEVSPHLAYDTEATVREAKRLWQAFDRPNAMIKVPATREGLPAIRELTAAGINVNATLLFSLPRYREVAEVYLLGLEDRVKAGKPIDRIASVASFFLSRIDVLIDKQLDALAQSGNGADTKGLRGEAAIASARLAYQDFKGIYSESRWDVLAQQGVRHQRLLWASTSTKDPSYSDVKYVEALIGPNTVNTLPVETVATYREHGQPALCLEDDLEKAREVLNRLGDVEIDLAAVTDQLEREGVQKFIDPLEKLLQVLEQRGVELSR